MKTKKPIKCPKCKKGTLDLLSKSEMIRLEEFEGKDNYPKQIMGCDECKYWIDKKEL